MLKNYSVAIWPINLATPLTPLQENQNWVCRKLSDGIKKQMFWMIPMLSKGYNWYKCTKFYKQTMLISKTPIITEVVKEPAP